MQTAFFARTGKRTVWLPCEMSMPDEMQFLSCAWLPRRVNVVVADPIPCLFASGLWTLSIGRISAAFSFCPFLVARVVVILDLAVSSSSSTTLHQDLEKDADAQCHQTFCQILTN